MIWSYEVDVRSSNIRYFSWNLDSDHRGWAVFYRQGGRLSRGYTTTFLAVL